MTLTETLAEFALSETPGPTQLHAARRTLLNAVGVAAGGSVSIPARLTRDLSLPGTATVIGHGRGYDPRSAAEVNGVAAHVEDFDDTHMATIVHPGASIVPAALAAAELEGASGAELLEAVAFGVEIALRLGLGVHPDAFDRGWHMSSVVGATGAAAAAGRLLGLDEAAMCAAIAIGAAQGAGTQEALGTMTKPLHLGRAAANGLEAALLARAGLTAAGETIAGEGGLLQLFAGCGGRDDRIVAGLGETWELEFNSFKPYACGVVSHAAIDAGSRLRADGCDWRRVQRVNAQTNPVVLDVMGVREPGNELEAKFSTYHCMAVALRYGGAAPAQFRDDVVRDPEVAALRTRVHVHTDPGCGVEEAELEAVLDDGTTRRAHVRHALGTPLSPLSDDDLCDKVRLTAGEVLGTAQTEKLIDALFEIGRAPSVAEMLALTLPEQAG
jgi:2-methylcitrate dehydratase PrpD